MSPRFRKDDGNDINDSVNELFAPPNNNDNNGERQSTFHINDDSLSQIKDTNNISPSDPIKGGGGLRGMQNENKRKSKGGGTYGEEQFEDMMIHQTNTGKMPSMIQHADTQGEISFFQNSQSFVFPNEEI